MKSARELIKILNDTDETTCIEAKECTTKVDRSVMETICAFANEPNLDGGYIVLGLRANNSNSKGRRYEVVGVTDPDKLQNDIATQCASLFNHRIAVQTLSEKIGNKTVIVIFVPEGEKQCKPYYFAKTGLPKGAYRRVGCTDQQCSDDDMPLLYAKSDDFDKGLVEDTTLDDIDENALYRYRVLRSEVNPPTTYKHISLLFICKLLKFF